MKTLFSIRFLGAHEFGWHRMIGSLQKQFVQRWGFNELKHRQDDLCNLLKNGCTSVTTVSLSDLLRTLSFIPLPTKSH